MVFESPLGTVIKSLNTSRLQPLARLMVTFVAPCYLEFCKKHGTKLGENEQVGDRVHSARGLISNMKLVHRTAAKYDQRFLL